MEKKTFRYTVTFTIETSCEVKPQKFGKLEEMAADVWDGGTSDESKKLIVDSYGFSVEKA